MFGEGVEGSTDLLGLGVELVDDDIMFATCAEGRQFYFSAKRGCLVIRLSVSSKFF